MGDAQAPGGYFVGRPANYDEKPQDAGDAQNRGSTPDENPEQQQAGQALTTGGQKKPGFLGNLFSCFSAGGRVES